MEKAEIEAPKPSETPLFSFTRCRSHLKSDTYTTLVRILSHCYENSQLPSAAQVLHPELNSDYGSDELEQATGKEVCESSELVGPSRMEPQKLATQKETESDESSEVIGVQDRGFSDAQHVGIDEMERIMAIEENEDLSKCMDMTFVESADGIGLQDRRFCPEKFLRDELEHILTANKEPVNGNNINPPTASSDKNQGSSDNAIVMNTKAEHIACQDILMERDENEQKNTDAYDLLLDKNVIGEVLESIESGKDKGLSLKTNSFDIKYEMQQMDIEMEKSVSSSHAMNFHTPITKNTEIEKGIYSSQNISEAFDLSLDKDMIDEPPKRSENMDEESSFLKTDVVQSENETPRAQTQLEKSVHSSNSLNSPNMAEDVDVEEGEISGDCGTDDKSLDKFTEDAIVSGENSVDGVQVSLDVFDKKEFHHNELNGAKGKAIEFTSFNVDTVDNANNSREVEPEECNGNKMTLRPEMSFHQKPMEAKIADMHDILLEDGKNRKKGGAEEGGSPPPACPSNLESLAQISPKNTTDSHRITSTEEQHANSCKKKKRGPLSKEKKEKKKLKERKRRAEKNRELGVKRLKLYPVSKPKTVTYCRHYLKGRCHQGDKCQFSHDTVPLTKSTPCSYFARHSCMKGDDCPFDHQLSNYPCDNYVKGFCSRGDACMFSHKIPTKEDSTAPSNYCEPELKAPSSLAKKNIKKQLNIMGSSVQNDVFSNSTGAHPPTNVKTLVKPSAVAPKRISRLLTAEKSPVVNFSMLTQGSFSPSSNGRAKVGNLAISSASDTFQKMAEIPNRTSLSGVPKGINFLSFGKAPLDDSVGKNMASMHSNGDSASKLTLLDSLNLPKQDSTGQRKAISPSGCDTVIDRAVIEGQAACSKYPNSNSISSRLLASVIASSQSSDTLASVNYKDAPNSARKALSLTQFAAKYGSKMKMNQSVSSLSLSTEVGKNTNSITIRSSQNDLAKASKILDFLSCEGSKTKL
ncbi:hypothetical protein F2P56_002448 [Juglans regia]|uniref:Zinc finger CCCH domain-containing protein 65 n=2 Tax=Juglans regia TaxID=51240 RepID=A0A2I4GNJ3_JUGRE|nr:zinc finger CCCH domain-containing protein 65 [Juglans regia]XP_035549205.1 zinc finger CCCH domain-containing protein 65 [Juglans regia]KAF5481828.1 hypothetical protein F2P56_002448 [Juglans regia]